MSRQVPRRKVLAWSGLLAAAVVVAVAAVYVIFWPVSDLIAKHDVGAVTGRGYGTALQAARDAARGRLVTFSAGLFAAGALIYTARNRIHPGSLPRAGAATRSRPLPRAGAATRYRQSRTTTIDTARCPGGRYRGRPPGCEARHPAC